MVGAHPARTRKPGAGPVLRTAKALRDLAPGEGLSVRCTDPMAAIDIPNLPPELPHRAATALCRPLRRFRVA
jgi:hypothetical protein